MTYDPNKHHRRSIRLKGFDYHNAGAYFVTICTKNRECILDDIVLKSIITDVWLALPLWFPTIELDEFVIMPNHTHFVLWLLDVGTPLAGVLNTVGMPLAGILNTEQQTKNVGIPLAGIPENQDGGKPRPYKLPQPEKINLHPTLSDGIGAFKSLVFKVYLHWIGENNLSRQAKFWQSNYYEHIIRNQKELNAIRQYIINNPINWEKDS